MFETIAIAAKPHAQNINEILTATCNWLLEHGVTVRIEDRIGHLVGVPVERMPRKEMLRGADLVIVFGGDGTFISVANTALKLDVPMLGVNVGSLGFLTEVTLDEHYESLSAILDGKYRIDERIAITAKVISASSQPRHFLAVNDFVINKEAIARMVDIRTYVDGVSVSRYRGDGLIVSTPTGSTAYSLAAGGPIVYPTLGVFVLSPICPHTLTNRPIVVPDHVTVKTRLYSKGQVVNLTIDGQEAIPLLDGDEVIITKAKEKLRLVQTLDTDYYSILRKKLSWGRNLGQE